MLLFSFIGLFSIGISKLKIEENIFSVLPKGESFAGFTKLIDNSDLTNQVIVSMQITADDDDLLITSFSDSLNAHTNKLLKNIVVERPDVEQEVYEYFYSNFPIFISDSYYKGITSKIEESSIKETLPQTQKDLLSPGGFLLKQFLLKDPLGISIPFFKTLNKESNNTNYNVKDGYLLTDNDSKVLITAKTTFKLSDNKRNVLLYHALTNFKTNWNKVYPNHQVDFFGTFQISAENSIQVKKDTYLTLIITIVIILLILFIYYRKILIPIYFMLPLIFGALFSLGMIGFFKTEISGISLATGAVVFGIVLDFSFHFFTHLQHSKSIKTTINDVSLPLLMGGGTTVLAFGALMFTNSIVLKDFGLFAGLSLVGSALFTLIGLPVVLKIFNFDFNKDVGKQKLVDFSFLDQVRKPLLILIVALTVVFFYFSFDVQFDNDLNNLSYHTKSTKDKEIQLVGINPEIETKLFIFSESDNYQKACLSNYIVYQKLKALQKEGEITSSISLAKLLVPDTIAAYRINRWNTYWTENRNNLLNPFDSTSEDLGFNKNAFSGFKNWISTKSLADASESKALIKTLGLDGLLFKTANKTTFITTVILKKENVVALSETLSTIKGVTTFNKSQVATELLSVVKQDFNYILIVSSLLVFVCLLLIYGRIELALFTFIPMVISWIWILGIASIFDIKFNFVNIIIATFIFGLGDDFSIFVTDGLLHKYKYKKDTLKTYNTAIVLSALTTIVGTGVLFLAKHPAIHSVALISVLGIVCILFISIVIQPYLFKLFIQGRIEQKRTPVTFVAFAVSLFEFPWFVFGCFITYPILGILFITPLPKKTKRKVLNATLSAMAWSVMYSAFHFRKKFINKENFNFDKPAIIIANHTSFLDILMMMLISPKIIIVVKDWVYNSVFFGPIVRYAGYIFVGEGAAKDLELIKERIADGYSILIFPEGSRGETDKIRRFHKGAFYLAKELNLDIIPVLIHGNSYVLPKSEFFVRHGYINIKVLPRISANETTWGETFGKRTKSISAYYKEEYLAFKNEQETAKKLFPRIFANYIYKGPLLEWYLKVKWRFEAKNYDDYHQILADKNRILDVGCGYGYLSYFLHYKNENREILGVDYDEEKINIANNGFDHTDKLNFKTVDVTSYQFENYDAIIFNDVLHYFSKEKQLQVLENCAKVLNNGGIILIRDGVTDFKERHSKTKLTELFSTKLLSFNKKEEAFHFFSSNDIKTFSKKYNLTYQMQEQSSKTSNVLFILKKI